MAAETSVRCMSSAKTGVSVMTKPPTIRKAAYVYGHTLVFRNAAERDAGYIHSLRSQGDRARFLSPTPSDPCHQLAWLTRYAEDEGQAYFVITTAQDFRPVGTVRLYGARGRAFSWGSWILEAGSFVHWAIESALMVYHYARWLSFTAAYFEVMQANQTVRRFHERFGARRVGAERGHFQYELGEQHMLASLKKYGRYLPNCIRVEA